MPQLLPLAGALLATTVEWYWGALIVAAASWASSELMEEDMPTAIRDLNGIKRTTRSTTEPLPVVYGEKLVGGNDVFIEATGTDNKDLWIVQTLAEGECDSIAQVDSVDQVFLDGKLPSEFGGNVSYWFHNGSSSQTVDTNLNTAIPAWTDTLRHTCYIVWKLTFDPDYFNSFPKRTVLLKGKKLYDFRDLSTAYDTNAVLAMYDYFTNTRYGMGKDSSLIDTTDWTTTANYVDTKAWAISLGITGGNIQANMNRFAMLFRGQMVWYDGKFYLRYADLNDESSVLTINDEHIIQSESGEAQLSISQPGKFGQNDAIKVAFIDPEKDHAIDYVTVGDALGVVGNLKIDGCADREYASNIGTYTLERQKLNRTITGLFRDDCVQLEPHDVVDFNSTALSISDQTMRVARAEIQPDGLIGLTFSYEDLTLYDDDYNINAEGVYTCNLPDKYATIPAVINGSLTEETYNHRLRTFTRLKVTFDPPTGYPWYSHVEVWWSDDDVTYKHLFNTTNDFNIDPTQEGSVHYIRLKSVSLYGNKTSDGNDLKLSKTVLGLTDAPTSLTDLQALVNENAINLYSGSVLDSDQFLVEFRLGDTWSGAVFLGTNVEPDLSLNGVKPGDFTFWGNTRSNNGEYGVTPRSATASLVDPPDGWTVQGGLTETCDYNAIGTHDNTEYIFYDSDDYLKCSHTGAVLTGTYTSPEYDKTASGRYLVYVLADIVVVGGGTSWDAQFPLTLTGSELITDGAFSNWTVDDLDSWTESNCDASEDVSGETGSAAKVTLSADDGYIYQDITVVAGDWHKLDFYYKNTAADVATFGVYDNTNSGWITPDDVIQLSDNTSFTNHSYLFKAPSGCVSVRIIFGAVSNGDIVWFDTASCKKIDEANSTTWNDVGSTKTWNEIFEPSAAPSVSIKLLYGDTSPPTNEVSGLEILSAIVTARYYQVEITITDPTNEIYAYVQNFTLKFCQ